MCPSDDPLALVLCHGAQKGQEAPAERRCQVQVRFVEHLHQGYETLTLVYAGRLACADSTGQGRALQAGDLQWVTAGQPVTHAELAESDDEVHLIQLWLNLPVAHKRCPPRTVTVAAADVPVFDGSGAKVRAIVGEFDGKPAATQAKCGARVLEVSLEAGGTLSVPLASDELGVAYVTEGELTVGPTAAGAGQLVHFSSPDPEPLRLSASQPTRLLVVHAPTLREPVVVNGPFVMNTAKEIKQAWTDFRAKIADERGLR